MLGDIFRQESNFSPDFKINDEVHHVANFAIF